MAGAGLNLFLPRRLKGLRRINARAGFFTSIPCIFGALAIMVSTLTALGCALWMKAPQRGAALALS